MLNHPLKTGCRARGRMTLLDRPGESPEDRGQDEVAPASPAVDDVCWQTFSVPYSYPVCFTRDVFNGRNRSLVDTIVRQEPDRRHRLVTIVDAGVAAGWPDLDIRISGYMAQHAERLEPMGQPIVVPGGEAAKADDRVLGIVLDAIQAAALDRQSFIVAIGGGAMLDVVGYAAAIAHRGVRLIRLPTTVLAQNDAGIGVKNAINAYGTKNYLGTFAPPFAVINDLDFIATLEPRDKIAGIAEAVKVGLIRDAGFFDWIEANIRPLAACDAGAMEVLIRRCAALHLDHIATCGDPFEMRGTRPLDFGHWSAHKLESLTGGRLRHGEAVAIGMALDSRYCVETGRLESDRLQRIVDVLEGVGFRLWDNAADSIDDQGNLAILRGLAEFREHLGGELSLTMLEDIGRASDVSDVDEQALIRSMEWLRGRSAR